jgi:preprotein translocase subunit SecE
MEDTKTIAKKASILDFFTSVVVESRKIDWPSREKTIRLTAIVIAVSLVIGVFIGGLDILFTKGVETLLALKK